MSNVCDFDMKVKGHAGNIQLLLDYLNARYWYIENGDKDHLDIARRSGYPYEFHMPTGKILFATEEKHFWRVIETEGYPDIILQKGDGTSGHEKAVWELFGTCAWSVGSCMLDEYASYYAEHKANPAYSHQYCLEQASKDLDLKIELFSTEPGCQFTEHYVIQEGAVQTREVFSYEEYIPSMYETRAEMEKEVDLHFSEEEWRAGMMDDVIIRTDCPHFQNGRFVWSMPWASDELF